MSIRELSVAGIVGGVCGGMLFSSPTSYLSLLPDALNGMAIGGLAGLSHKVLGLSIRTGMIVSGVFLKVAETASLIYLNPAFLIKDYCSHQSRLSVHDCKQEIADEGYILIAITSSAIAGGLLGGLGIVAGKLVEFVKRNPGPVVN
jgi:hypothetical protein